MTSNALGGALQRPEQTVLVVWVSDHPAAHHGNPRVQSAAPGFVSHRDLLDVGFELHHQASCAQHLITYRLTLLPIFFGSARASSEKLYVPTQARKPGGS